SLSMNASQTPTSPAPGLTNGGAGENQGIAVVPSTGQPSSDEALKEKIQASFSDQVEVHPDQSGTTGVITPVFKTAKGKDFVYVMVPINSSPPQPSSQPPDTSSAGANL
ncbi:MAG: hypothetical protein KGI59_02275, partial [Patescibacteria group bacterium]|nr:hypothetical protein [Patescibacteria group bacterium]